jgi:Fic family protein
MIRLSQIITQSQILYIIARHGSIGISEIEKRLSRKVSRPTLSRYLKELKEDKLIVSSGSARGVTYTVDQIGMHAYDMDLDVYDSNDIPTSQTLFSHDLFKKYEHIFSDEEIAKLNETTERYRQWKEKTPSIYQTLAYERCAIEFAWKSSKIEGNSYSLIETEVLIKNKIEANGKPHDDATMILNQKKVFDLTISEAFRDLFLVQTLIDIHKLLVTDLNIPSDLRTAQVGITGTNYTPLRFKSQISEALDGLFALVKKENDSFQVALVLLAGIAYIQPFADGNKRTSRHMANAILHKNNMPPVAWRVVDEVEYKKCMIVFYELGNIRPLAQLWLENYIETTKTFFTE